MDLIIGQSAPLCACVYVCVCVYAPLSLSLWEEEEDFFFCTKLLWDAKGGRFSV